MEEHLNLRNGQLEQALKFLSMEEPTPVLRQGPLWTRTPVPYVLDAAHIQRLMQRREQEWQQVVAYVDHHGCRMEYIQAALDDEHRGPCGHCANCLGKHFKTEMAAEDIARAAVFLQRTEAPLKCPVQMPAGGLRVLDRKGNIPPELRPEPGRILSRWGDAGWGKLVAQHKHEGRFGDALVNAVADMIRERWRPEPALQWVTCVPSLRHPELVPDFAHRLAVNLGLPFHPTIAKARQNEPQKIMQNRHHQCTNLDGAFTIDTPLPEGPVLLVDDVVDSGWTFAIIAAQLRQAGSNLVYPVALASTSHA